MVSLTVTRHALTLGAVDAVTGHPTLGYVDSIINMIMEPIGADQTLTDAGVEVTAKYRGFTGEALEVGDRIENSAGTVYAVLTCLPHRVGDITDHYESTLAVVYPPPSGGVGDTWLLEIVVMPIGYGTTSPSGVVVVAAGSSLQVTAAAVGVSTFAGWIFDGANVGTTNPYTVAAQTAGSSHILIAVFSRHLLPPVYSGLLTLSLGYFASPQISEVGHVYGEDATETISETGAATTPTASSFGDSTIEATTENLAANNYRVCKFTAGANGSTFKLLIYGSGSSARPIPVLYSDNAGVPDVLIGFGLGIAPPAVAGWFELELQGLTITNGTVYWIGVVNTTNTFTMYYAAGTANQAATKSGTAPSNPFPASPTYTARKYSFQCFTR